MNEPKTTQGRRVLFQEGDAGDFATGEHGLFEGCWYGRTPTGLLSNLAGHKITEHEDGTITAAPSIETKCGDGRRWHGYLERGVWRELEAEPEPPEEDEDTDTRGHSDTTNRRND